jgi:hypothetical protein
MPSHSPAAGGSARPGVAPRARQPRERSTHRPRPTPTLRHVAVVFGKMAAAAHHSDTGLRSSVTGRVERYQWLSLKPTLQNDTAGCWYQAEYAAIDLGARFGACYAIAGLIHAHYVLCDAQKYVWYCVTVQGDCSRAAVGCERAFASGLCQPQEMNSAMFVARYGARDKTMFSLATGILKVCENLKIPSWVPSRWHDILVDWDAPGTARARPLLRRGRRCPM